MCIAIIFGLPFPSLYSNILSIVLIAPFFYFNERLFYGFNKEYWKLTK